jgi:hypothetical protein
MPADRVREREVQASIFLARLIGPLLLIPGIGIVVKPRVFRTMATEVIGSVTLVYLFGLFDFAAGLAVVLTHNVWAAIWRVLITLIGWIMLVRGAMRILIPDMVMGYAAKLMHSKQALALSSAALVILGLVLCYFGYSARG